MFFQALKGDIQSILLTLETLTEEAILPRVQLRSLPGPFEHIKRYLPAARIRVAVTEFYVIEIMIKNCLQKSYPVSAE